MLNTFVLALALLGQRPAAHPGGHVGGAHAGGAAVHPSGHAGVAMEHQVMQGIAQHEAEIQQQYQLRMQHHAAMISQDLPHLQAHFKEMRFEQKHWQDLRYHHNRLGVDTYWRLARKHREVDKLLAALREEKVPARADSAEGRLARVKARRETWDNLAESRFSAYLKERKFDHKDWDDLRRYHDRLGADTFWRLAREHREIEKLRPALSFELRRELLAGIDEEPRGQPIQAAKPAPLGLIEISPTGFKPGKTADSPSISRKDRQ